MFTLFHIGLFRIDLFRIDLFRPGCAGAFWMQCMFPPRICHALPPIDCAKRPHLTTPAEHGKRRCRWVPASLGLRMPRLAVSWADMCRIDMYRIDMYRIDMYRFDMYRFEAPCPTLRNARCKSGA